MKRHWIALGVGASVAGGAHAALDNAAAEAMMKKDGCAACHEIDKKLIGPAFQDVAVKYKGDKDAAAKLRDKVKKDGCISGARRPCRRTSWHPTSTSRIWWTGS
jgi:cytochrome c